MSQVGNYTMFVNHVASGNGPYVTLVHALVQTCSPGRSHEASRALFTVVRLDLRGHLSRADSTCTLDDFAFGCSRRSGTRAASGRATLRFSLGGLIAQSLAFPDRSTGW